MISWSLKGLWRYGELLEGKKNTLTELLGVRAQGVLVRSRFHSVTLMDAPSKFFFIL